MAFFLIQDPGMRERFMIMMNTRAAANPMISKLKKFIATAGPGSDMVIFSEVVIEWEKQQAEKGGPTS